MRDTEDDWKLLAKLCMLAMPLFTFFLPIPAELSMSRTAASLASVCTLLIGAFIQAQSPFPLEQISQQIESLVRSTSQASNRPSMALIDRETARSMSYDNQIKHTKTYFEKRKLNRSYRQSERRPRQTSDQIRRRSAAKAPDRLTVNQYDQVGGRMNWPIVLKDASYSSQRSRLDRLFASHAAEGSGIQTSQYAGIQTAIEAMLESLRSNRSSTNMDQYMYAIRFLNSLSYEARIPVGA